MKKTDSNETHNKCAQMLLKIGKSLKKLSESKRTYLLVIISYIVLMILKTMGLLSSMFTGLLVPLCSYLVAALSLNLVVGISGELSLGQAGFMSIGGFSGVVVAHLIRPYIDSKVIVLIIAIVVGIIVASLFGFVVGIPVLKLEGDYLAIVTLAFGQIVKTLISNMYIGLDENGLQMSFSENTTSITDASKMIINGPSGLSGNERMSTFTVGAILVMLTLIIIFHLLNSKQGRAIMACRDNKIAARSVGIDVSKYKLTAFVVAAGLAGAAGVLYIMNYGSMLPKKFDYNLSIMILVYVVMGGLGKLKGTIISTAVLLILPEMLRDLKDYRMLIYAIVLIVIMLITNNENLKNKWQIISNRFKKKGVEHE